jgi:hypothetical protein
MFWTAIVKTSVLVKLEQAPWLDPSRSASGVSREEASTSHEVKLTAPDAGTEWTAVAAPRDHTRTSRASCALLDTKQVVTRSALQGYRGLVSVLARCLYARTLSSWIGYTFILHRSFGS